MSKTYAELEALTRGYADEENSNFISATLMKSFINGSYAELRDLLITNGEDGDFCVNSTPQEVTISSGNTVSLPATTYKVVGVDYEFAPDQWTSLKSFDWNQRNDRVVGFGGCRWHSRKKYRLIGDKLMIVPSDDAAGTYRIWEVAKTVPLTADEDTIDDVNGFDDYIAVDAAIKCLIKKEADTTKLERKKAQLEARINNMIRNRDMGSPQRVQDVRRDSYGDFDDGY
jgi:hypothetical protein